MRKLICTNRNLVVAILFSCFAFVSKAQTLSFTTGTSVMCGTTPTYVMLSIVTNSYANTAYHIWSINSNSCSYLFSSTTNSANYHTYCPGTYTIYCTALASNTTITLGTYSQVVNVSPANAQWSAAPSQTACAGNTFTMSYTGASTYTTVGPGVNLTGSTALLTPTANTCYSVLSSGSTCSISVFCLSVTSQPNITVNNATICLGSTVTLLAPGASSYTWSTGANTWSTQVSPTVSTCYTVSGSLGNCPGTSSAVACVQVNSPPTLTVSGGVACAGTSVNYTAQGATNYTWLAVSGGTWSGYSSTTSIPPQVTCFKVGGKSTTNNCLAWSGTICPTFIPSPTITVASNNSVICAGDTVQIIANGGVTYTWSTGSTQPQQYLVPTSTNCYTVAGSNLQGCTSSAVICVTVNPGPALSVMGSTAVCLGSSATYTATGGSNYSWSTGPTTSTLYILPATTTVLSVSSIGSNGCSSTYSFVLIANSGCADVWPGDANSDGTANASDVFEIGLGFNATGATRNQASNTWASQLVTSTWAGTVSSGKNLCHADCNGDGTINHSDTVAIFNNFGLTHAFKPAGSSSNPDISLIAPAMANAGIWNVADVVVGSSTANISQLYGVSFDLNFDVNVIDDAYLVYTSSFLSASNQNVEFRKNFISNGKVVGATVRTNKANVSGYGKIAELHYKVKNGVQAGTQLDFSVSNSQKISKDGILGTLLPGTLTQHVATSVGLDKQDLPVNLLVYPNPASDRLTVQVTSHEEAEYRLADVTGRIVSVGTFAGEVTVDISALKNGVYFVTIETLEGSNTQKVIIDHR